MELIILLIALHLGFLLFRGIVSTIFLGFVWVGGQIFSACKYAYCQVKPISKDKFLMKESDYLEVSK